MHKIQNVVKDSIADRKGIQKGDYLVSINNQKINDILDYMYATSDDRLNIQIQKQQGRQKTIKIKNTFHYPLGIEFEHITIDQPKSCRNKCIFCFIDQLPANMRKSLYFKDDDYRMCFLFGNYITLTNTTQDDLDRIVQMHLSPVNISVHTTNPALRIKMLNNKSAGDILNKIEYLAEHNIDMQMQIVLCPDINDGEELKKTLRDLSDFYPGISSVSVVDVGLTKYRNNLYPLKNVDQAKALEIIEIINEFQRKMLDLYGTRWVYCSDEIYIKAQKKMPDYAFYEEFLQYQNGVGFIAALRKEFYDEWRVARKNDYENVHISVATGVSIAPFIKELCDVITDKFNIKINVYAIENNFFGKSITASGLLTGQDIINTLKGKTLGEKLLLPSVLLRSDTDLLLDDITINDIENELNVKIEIVPQNGAEFLKSILYNRSKL
jgi:putative radical SAM enzyme (TIGR03279 family)